MTIGIDLDDVLLDFNNGFLAYNKDAYGICKTRNDIYTYDIEKVWDCSREEIMKRVFDFYKTEAHARIPTVPGSSEAIRELAKNHTLHIVTSRHNSIADITRSWIERHFPGLFKEIHFSNGFSTDEGKKRGKADICRELGIEYFIDDALENARPIAAAGIPVLLLDTPWNQEETASPIRRVHSWPEIVKLLNQ